MSLQTTVAVPFRQRGTTRMGEGEFVVAVSLDRDWFSTNQATRLIDVAAGRGLLRREDGDVVATFEPTAVEVPDGFVPEESVLREQSLFERLVDRIVAEGVEKREAVAGANRLQQELEVTLETAAVLFARRRGVDVSDLAGEVRESLEG